MPAEPLVVEVRVADREPVAAPVKGAGDAAEMFATLTEAERDALPDAALYGIARLRGAIAGLTGEAPPPAAEEPEQYRGVIIIEWPAPYGVLPYSSVTGTACSVFDAMTGKPIPTCLKITVHADPASIVTADLTMLTGADGSPLLDAGGEPAMDPDGREYLTGTFPFAVAAMRVRDAG